MLLCPGRFIDQVEFMRQLEKKPKRKVFEPRKVATQAKLTARVRVTSTFALI
jgi:hypothetical protein